MADVPQAPPGDCNKQIYNVPERAILDQFKAEYVSIPSKPARKQFFTSRIWPAMYRYWYEKHSLTSNESTLRAKSLSGWIHNNWRLPHTGGKKRGILTVRKSDVIWKMREADVWKEIASILNVPEASTRTPQWFPTRLIAIQNIISRMDENETKLLDQQVQDIEEKGYPEEQKRAFAEKHCTRRLDTAAKAHWLEMGLMTLSVVAYRRTDGRLSVEIHENASNLVGVGEHCFDDEHEGKAREIRRVWLDYVRNILEEKEGGPTPIVNADAAVLLTSQDGFPIFPDDFSVDKLKKKQGEKLLREYFKKNYVLATGGQSDEVPYKEMTKSISERKKFVHDKFLPRGIILRDPHNLKLEEIQRMLKFFWDRQQAVAPAQVFRFHAFKPSRKGQEIFATMYPDEIDPNNPPEIRKKKPRKQKRTAVLPANAENSTRNANAENTTQNADAENPSSEAAGQILHQPGLYTMSATPEPQRPPAPNDNMADLRVPIMTGNSGVPIESNAMSSADPHNGPTMPTGQMMPSVDGNSMNTMPVNSWAMNFVGNDMTSTFQQSYPRYDLGANHWQTDLGYQPTAHFISPWNENQPVGVNGYAPAPEGIDYGVPLNLVSVDWHDNDAEDYSRPEIPTFIPGQGMLTQQSPSTSNQHNNMLTQSQNYASPNLPQNMYADANADADADGSMLANKRAEGQHAAPQSTTKRAHIGTAERPRGKRTADDIAAAEAEIMSTQLGSKRQRKPKVRES